MDYSTILESRQVFRGLLEDQSLPLPEGVRSLYNSVSINGTSDVPAIPSPWRETEAITALKALEASLAISLGKIRYGLDQTAEIDVDHATTFLFMSYLSTIDGYGKWDPRSVQRLKPTDLFRAQSSLYRRLSANMYKTKEQGVYYHTHGSLEATPILEMLGLPGYNDELEDYNKICDIIEERCKGFTAAELDKGTEERRQAGATVYKRDEFLQTEQGKALAGRPLFSVEALESESPPCSFPIHVDSGPEKPQLLTGIKVLDLTRVIAGPTISRTLAEYGASVLKITSPTLPDVPYYQLDLNFGKRAAELDLRNPADRKIFERLLDEDGGVDVIVDGYRTGALERLGYGVEGLTKRFAGRGKGFVYVAENCFGFVGPWKERSGWQPIADAVSGLNWGQGLAMGLNEPVLPPFPLSDYGTGELGAIAALTALHHRATKGGSYFASVSLTEYNLWVMSLSPYPDPVWQQLRTSHYDRRNKSPSETEVLDHRANFDVVSKAAIKSMRRLHPRLFEDKFMFEMWADGFGGMVKSCRPVVKMSGTLNWWRSTTRPNGWDKPTWD